MGLIEMNDFQAVVPALFVNLFFCLGFVKVIDPSTVS